MQMQVQHRQWSSYPALTAPGDQSTSDRHLRLPDQQCVPTSSSKCPGSASARPLATRAVAEAEGCHTGKSSLLSPRAQLQGSPGLEIKVKREDLDGGPRQARSDGASEHCCPLLGSAL